MQRRTVLKTCGAAALALATPAILHARPAVRTYDLFRGSKRIGSKSISVDRSGANVSVAISIDIKVRILGLPAYSYALRSDERWSNGQLMRLEGRTNDNGENQSVSATRRSGGIEIAGTGFNGVVKGNVGTTTYWANAFLDRPTWISTQSGKPLNVQAVRAGRVKLGVKDQTVQATQWQIRGDIDRLDLFYDQNGEWVGSEFDARGQTARFLLSDRGADFAPLWVEG